MAISRTITSTSGSNNAIRDAIVLQEPRRGTLGNILTEALGEYVETGIGVVDFARSRVAIFPLTALAAVTAAFANAGGELAEFIPETPLSASSRYTMTGGLYVPGTPAVAGRAAVLADQDLFSDGTNVVYSSGSEIAPAVAPTPAVPAEDPLFLFDNILSADRPTYTVAGLINAIEDTIALQANQGKTGIVLVNQQTRRTLLRMFDISSLQNSSDVSAVSGALAVFAGAVPQTVTVARQYGDR